jgi:hypothetical protein
LVEENELHFHHPHPLHVGKTITMMARFAAANVVVAAADMDTMVALPSPEEAK